MNKIRAGIVGYGNIGRGAEKAIQQCPDFELAAVLTRRSPENLSIDTPTALKVHVDDALSLKGKVDVMILCGGSATDLPVQGPEFAKLFNTVDSYDTHAKIPEYYKAMDEASRAAGLASVISAGWDPGLFSMNRVLAQAILPNGSGCTFWGKGVSQGHSDAIRRVNGVEAAVQYTIPLDAAIEKARKGEGGLLSTREKHLRECFVVAKEGADKAEIEKKIKTMPHYFADYDTIVHFISGDEFAAEHKGMAHGGFVIHSESAAHSGESSACGESAAHSGESTVCGESAAHSGESVVRGGETGGESAVCSGETGGDTVVHSGETGGRHVLEFSLSLHHNAEFTASVLVAYARAAYRCHLEGLTGAHTVLDIPLAWLSPKPAEELRRDLL